MSARETRRARSIVGAAVRHACAVRLRGTTRSMVGESLVLGSRAELPRSSSGGRTGPREVLQVVREPLVRLRPSEAWRPCEAPVPASLAPSLGACRALLPLTDDDMTLPWSPGARTYLTRAGPWNRNPSTLRAARYRPCESSTAWSMRGHRGTGAFLGRRCRAPHQAVHLLIERARLRM